MNTFLKYLGLVVLVLACFFAELHILLKIWNIVVVPLGAPHLNLFQIWGVRMLAGSLTLDASEKPKKSTQESVIKALTEVCTMLICWGVVYLVLA